MTKQFQTIAIASIGASVLFARSWNYPDYSTKFAGQDVLKLKFEIHIEK